LALARGKTSTILPSRLPIVQAPMAGAQGAALAIAVCEAGGLGSLPCAMLTPAELRAVQEKSGGGDFSPLWSGEAAALAREEDAAALTRGLSLEALAAAGGLRLRAGEGE
jgi:nitronate monooxygenase